MLPRWRIDQMIRGSRLKLVRRVRTRRQQCALGSTWPSRAATKKGRPLGHPIATCQLQP